MLVVGLLFTVLVCFGVPIIGMVFMRKKYRGRWGVFLIGALAFFISQICIRIPLLTFVLPQSAWFGVMQLNPWYYGLFLGATAALFEEGARWIAMQIMKKRGMLMNAPSGGQEEICAEPAAGTKGCLTDGIVFGLGHGGIEAMLLVGVNAVILLGMAAAGMETLITAQAGVSLGAVFAGGAERMFAMTFHVGASLIITYGVRTGKDGRCFLLAFLIHMVLDAAVVIFPAIFGMGVLGIELWAAVIGILTLGIGILLCSKKIKKEK